MKMVRLCLMGAVFISLPVVAMKHERALVRAEREIGRAARALDKPIKEHVFTATSSSGPLLKELYDRATVIVTPTSEDTVKVALLGDKKDSSVRVARCETQFESQKNGLFVSKILETRQLKELFTHLAASYFFSEQQKNEQGKQVGEHKELKKRVFDCLISRESGSQFYEGHQWFKCFIRPCVWGVSAKRQRLSGTLIVEQEA